MAATYWTEKDGYERTKGNAIVDGEWYNTNAVAIHRLCAVAWFGWDAVAKRDVHHRVPVPWLNVESNLLPLPKAEHSQLTGRYGNRGIPESVIEDVTESWGGGVDG